MMKRTLHTNTCVAAEFVHNSFINVKQNKVDRYDGRVQIKSRITNNVATY